MRNVLYHYCSLETFKSIIENKTIRVSDCSKTNDFAETKWITTLISDVVIRLIKDDADFCNIYRINDDIIELIRKQIETTINAVYYENTRYMLTLVACFSEDGDLLSQWRGYANDAQGISIGFYKPLLQTFDTGGYNYHFKKVIYKEKEQLSYIQNHLGDLIYAYKQIEEHDNVSKLFIEFIQDLCGRISIIRNDSPIFKNGAFVEEKEWRLFVNNHLTNYYSYNDRSSNDGFGGDIEENYNIECEYNNGFVRHPTSYRTTASKIIPYFDLSFASIKDKLIKEIIIGPKSEVTELDIQVLLSTYGYNFNKVNIKKSRATYR